MTPNSDSLVPAFGLPDYPVAWADRCFEPHELDQVALAGLHTRFEIWAMFEGRKDVADDVASDLGVGPD
jgi:hypothetical protein